MKLLSEQTPGVYKWLPPDSAETLSQQPQYFQAIWKDADITYDINHLGFRGTWSEAPDEPYLLVTGDSFTFGTGIAFDKTWGELLGKHLNMPVVNLSVPGSSIEVALWNLVEWQAAQPKPTHIVWQWSSAVRHMLVGPNSWRCLLPYHLADDPTLSPVMRSTMINTLHEHDLQVDKMYKIKQYAKLISPAPKMWRPYIDDAKHDYSDLGLPIYNAPQMFKHKNLTLETLWKIKARDNAHWNEEVHQAYTDNIIKDFF